MLNTQLKKIKKGFTLVELLIVIIIIAVLAAIAIPKFSNSTQRSKDSALRSNLKLIRNAVDLFRADTGSFPATIGDLAATAAPTSGLGSTGATVSIAAADWRGPYLATTPVDPVTAGTFSYTVTGANTGKVATTASGNGSDGTAYSSW